MENLNKENLFNELYGKYPDAMKLFCDWIDKYKEEVDWNGRLFKNNHVSRSVKAFVKFHDLPIEMQIGIWIRFVKESFCKITIHEWEIGDLAEYDWKEDVRQHIMILDEYIKEGWYIKAVTK